MSTKWLIGLLFNTDGPKNVTSDLLSFSDTIYSQATSCKMYKEGMTVSATYMDRNSLCWEMPNGECKKVYSQKLKPTVSRPVSATVAANYTPAVSAGRAATKRKGCFDYEMPTKKAKADKESVSVANGSAFRPLVPSKPAPPATTPPAKKRPRSPQSETSSKKFKSDEEPAKGTSCQSSAGVAPGVSLSQSPSQSAISRGTKRPRSPEPETPSVRAKIDLSPPTVELSKPTTDAYKPVSPVRQAIQLQLSSRRD